MGICLSRRKDASIKISGNNNSVRLTNDMEVSVASIVQKLVNDINTENRTWMLVVTFSCVLMIILLLYIIFCVLIPAKHHLQQSYIMLNNIEDSFEHMNRRMKTTATQTDYLSISLFGEESDGRLDEYKGTKVIF